MKMLKWIQLLILSLMLSACGVQSIPQSKNKVDAAVAEVTNQYKRRSELIPKLVNTVKGYASHEKETLNAVINARAKATSVSIDASKLKPEDLAAFNKAQSGLSQSLGKLLLVAERYPNLKADASFQTLMSQIEGADNRITVAIQRLIAAINEFNNQVSVPPTSWTNSIFYNYEKLPQWTVENKEEVEKNPSVEF
jgi:LemA protein